MRVLLCVLVALAVAVAVPHREDLEHYTFVQYTADFNKFYHSPQEYNLHKKIFQQNLAKIKAHNRANHGWHAAVNKFTDMTAEESKKYRGYSSSMARSMKATRQEVVLEHIAVEALPSSVDWRTADPPILTDVKDQGGCGSCWAFATTEEIEVAIAQATKQAPPVLSPQNVVDCTPNPQQCGGTGGCAGATAELGMGYVRDYGISTDADYPYTAQTGTCQNATIAKVATISGFVKLAENNYTQLMIAVATKGPIAISVAAGAWNSYGGGVFTCDSSQVDIDHAVQLVGYGTDSDQGDYWIVRNSWGPGWGENGYIRIARHSDGDMTKWCGTDPTPADGSGCSGGPPTVTVCGSCGIWYDSSYPFGGKPWPHGKHHQH